MERFLMVSTLTIAPLLAICAAINFYNGEYLQAKMDVIMALCIFNQFNPWGK